MGRLTVAAGWVVAVLMVGGPAWAASFSANANVTGITDGPVSSWYTGDEDAGPDVAVAKVDRSGSRRSGDEPGLAWNAKVSAVGDRGLALINISAHNTQLSRTIGALTRTGAEATARFDDLIITGPTGVGTVSTSFNFTFQHTLDGFGLSDGALEVGIAVAGASRHGERAFRNGRITSSSGFLADGGTVVTDWLGRRVETYKGTSASVEMPLNQPISMSIFIRGHGDISYDWRDGSEGLTSGVENRAYVRFGASPVFNLPEGYTANSVEANIVDNYWMGVIPEPASAALLGLGGLLLAGRRRRVAAAS